MNIILSLSGGGIRGILSAVWLAELEERIGKPLHEVASMFAGTSTGAIQACCLVTGKYTAAQMVGFYRHHGAGIFQKNWATGFRYLMGAKYDHAYLEETLQNYLQERGHYLTMGEAKKPLMCEAFDVNVKRPLTLSSWDTPNLPMWQAARASSAAPTYFRPAVISVNGGRSSSCDGGLEANNPAADAYAQLRARNPKADDIAVISLGTGKRTRYTSDETAAKWNLLQWVPEVLAISMHTERIGTMMSAALKEKFVEIDCELIEGASDDMDNASPENMEALERLARVHIARQPESFDRATQLLKAA